MDDSADNKTNLIRFDSKEFRFDSIHWLWRRSKRASDDDGKLQWRNLNFRLSKNCQRFFVRNCLSKNDKFRAENLHFWESFVKS